MKLTEFKERAPRGTYYGARPTKDTCEAVLDFMANHKIPNPLTEDLMHVTICFSRVWCAVQALGDLDPHWQGNFEAYNVWPTTPKEGEEPSSCLTLGFACPEMHLRHQHLRREGATHDYPDFKPHLTLSYDVGNDYDTIHLPQYSGPLKFHHEYSEPLNLQYVKTKVNKNA